MNLENTSPPHQREYRKQRRRNISNHLLPRTRPVLDRIGGLKLQLFANAELRIGIGLAHDASDSAHLAAFLIVGFRVIESGILFDRVGDTTVDVDIVGVVVDLATLDA